MPPTGRRVFLRRVATASVAGGAVWVAPQLVSRPIASAASAPPDRSTTTEDVIPIPTVPDEVTSTTRQSTTTSSRPTTQTTVVEPGTSAPGPGGGGVAGVSSTMKPSATTASSPVTTVPNRVRGAPTTTRPRSTTTTTRSSSSETGTTLDPRMGAGVVASTASRGVVREVVVGAASRRAPIEILSLTGFDSLALAKAAATLLVTGAAAARLARARPEVHPGDDDNELEG